MKSRDSCDCIRKGELRANTGARLQRTCKISISRRADRPKKDLQPFRSAISKLQHQHAIQRDQYPRSVSLYGALGLTATVLM